MKILNYEIVEKVAEVPQTAVFKVYHQANPNQTLVLKVLKSINFSGYKKAQFDQKIEHLKVLKNPLLITPDSFEVNDGLCFITQEYFNGISLDVFIKEHPQLPLSDFFILACRLTQALEKIHEAGIIHGGIKPHNILVGSNISDIRLIDFISTVDVRDVSHFIYDRSFIRNTLSYTSPEQTGRINHRVVFSSDLYSLGIVFYEILTGELPFYSDDPLELIHSHLAKEAPQVHIHNPDIPVALSKIIAKLIIKQPEKRYQSAGGLLTDLMRCQAEYAKTGAIREFLLEKCVSIQKIPFVSKMVGRDKEAGTILEEYEQVVKGEFRSLLISGLSGIGKTRLIQELQNPIVKHKGYFTSGKFDIYQKNIPYSSLIQALKNLIRTFLTESNERAANWKKRILQSVGNNGKVLTDAIPELEILIGPQPDVKALPPVEALNRYHDLFDRFLTCLASEENPLTLFIDDLQWCDMASFDFLSNIMANYKDHPYFFLLGAYRHNEVDSSHPLSKLITNAKISGWPLTEIRLESLKPHHCHEMVSYILDSPRSKTKTLSDFISTLSEGNPLFVSESLSYLYNEGLLFFDEKRQWCWEVGKVNQSHMPTTVVALFSAKIQKLAPGLTGLLKYCACMGNSFSPNDISAINGMSLFELYELLKPALSQGLLIENKGQLQFIHDRVQEAVLSLIPAEDRRQIHRKVGSYLITTIPADMELEKAENLFAIVSHLNLGKEEKVIGQEAYFLSDLNYYAGNKALNSLATEAANEYFQISRSLLPDDCWNGAHYQRTFSILKKAAKTELMCGNYTNSERLLNLLLDHAITDLDKGECLAEQTTSLSSIGNFIKAIETANKGLSIFGKTIPEDPDEAQRKRERLISDIFAKDFDIYEAILNMPFTDERKSKIELAFYSELIPDLYMSGLVPQLYLSAAQSTQHCLSGGMDESVIYSFSIMGLLLGEQGDFEQAFRFEDLARDLSAKYPNTFGATRGMNGIVWCNMHSRSHPKQIVEYCLKSIQCGKNCGDLYNAGLSYGPLMWNLQVQGADMSAIEDYANECLQFSNRFNLAFSARLAEAMQAGWVGPMKKNCAHVSMDEKLRLWEKDNHIASAGSYCVHMAISHYYFGEYEEAGRYLEEVKRYLSGLTDNVLKRQWHVFLVLNKLKLFEQESGSAFDELIAEIRPVVEKIEAWAALGPLLKPYLVFVNAERERVTGSFKEARSLYLDAINIAHEQKYTFLEGHLNECLGELLLKSGQCTQRVYFAEAARLYRACGAERKESNLINKYPEYFKEEKAVVPQLGLETAAPNILPPLDIDYLMKSSIAIAAEIEQDTLLKKIMNVVIESSGAQHGYLLIQENDGLFVYAESHVVKKQIIRTVNRKLEDTRDICKAIARYVYRTGERLVLNNAAQEGIFKDNPEVHHMGLKSVLCLPVIKQSKKIGVLYLENRLSDAVFTSEKTQLTELLTSQAAISLENSRLVEEMKRAEEALRDAKAELEMRVLERTAELARTNQLLEEDITRRKQAEEQVIVERRRFNEILEILPVYVVLLTPDYHAPFANRVFRERFGEAHGKRCFEFLFGIDKPCENCQTYGVLETKAPCTWKWTGPDGRDYDVFDFPFKDADGSNLILEMGIDITDRNKAEAEIQKLNRELEQRVMKRTAELAAANEELFDSEAHLRSALHEKEVLLKEIHHRVKNNLQIIHSMLNLQLLYTKDEQVIELFKESKNRIFTMALIHEKLYQSESLARINLSEYIQNLIANLFLSYGISERSINPKIYVGDIMLNIDTIIPCALIMNELVSNALKYAFSASGGCPDRKKEIQIDLRHDAGNRYKLVVGDNGVGLPDDFIIQNSNSLGLKIVNILVRQLKGEIYIDRNNGTRFTILFEAMK